MKDLKHTSITRRSGNVTVVRVFRFASIEIWTHDSQGPKK